MHKTYDAIVLGVGGMGSAALYHLARRGWRVLGLEQFDIPHAMGSSHGLTRIIRMAYFEHPRYVPLLTRAYELWRELQRATREELLVITGSVAAGRPGSQVFEGSLTSCKEYGLTHEVLSRAELGLRFPAFRLPPNFQAVLQPEGGFLVSERCIVSHVFQALAAGGEVHARERVLRWEPSGDGVRVKTDRREYEASRLVLTAGPWTANMVDRLSGYAVPERQALGWFHPRRPELFQLGRFPVFNLSVDEGHFYGFPIYGIPGFKIGLYHHLKQNVDPDEMDREANYTDEAPLRACIEKYFPEASGPVTALKTCLFTNTADEHFILDLHPDHPQVSIAAGFSGHGFKFCSVVGEIMADLAQNGTTAHDVSGFSVDRFARIGD
jgi:sarcosine oxidase